MDRRLARAEIVSVEINDPKLIKRFSHDLAYAGKVRAQAQFGGALPRIGPWRGFTSVHSGVVVGLTSPPKGGKDATQCGNIGDV